ncbi:hypothetical protein Z169_04666, partial [Egretta garzetta]
QGCPQIVELHAVVMAFKQWDRVPLNIVCVVVGIVQRIERSQIKHIQNEVLFLKFKELMFLVERCTHPYCVLHVRSHTTLLGFFAKGNARADRLANVALRVPVPNTLSQARTSHQFFHQSAEVLSRQFSIPAGDAKLIAQTCPDCQQQSGPLTTVNPRGLSALRIWQTDVTHIPEFGRLKYVHVSIDTYSHALWATAMTGETTRHAQARFRTAFAALGVPKEIKTSNGPASISRSTRNFFHTWGITHKTGIPHSPTGQAIVERVHRTLEDLLAKQ